MKWNPATCTLQVQEQFVWMEGYQPWKAENSADEVTIADIGSQIHVTSSLTLSCWCVNGNIISFPKSNKGSVASLPPLHPFFFPRSYKLTSIIRYGSISQRSSSCSLLGNYGISRCSRVCQTGDAFFFILACILISIHCLSVSKSRVTWAVKLLDPEFFVEKAFF